MRFIERLSRFGSVCKILADSSKPESSLGKAAAAQQKLKELAEKIFTRLKQIQNDERFTATGQREEISKYALDAVFQLDQARPMLLGPVLSRYNELQKQVQSIHFGKDDANLAHAIQISDLRAAIKDLDNNLRIELFNKSIDRVDSVLFRAFVDHSEIFKLLDDKTIKAGKDRFLLKINPELGTEYQGICRASGILADNFRDFYTDLGSIGSIPDLNIKLGTLPTIQYEKTGQEIHAEHMVQRIRPELKPIV